MISILSLATHCHSSHKSILVSTRFTHHQYNQGQFLKQLEKTEAKQGKREAQLEKIRETEEALDTELSDAKK